MLVHSSMNLHVRSSAYVGDVRANGLGQEPGPTFYVPWAQLPDLHNANLTQITPLAWFVRARGEP